jgi:hypothetical protein
MKTNKYIKLIYQFALISILSLFNYASKAQTISTSPIPVTEYCAGASLVVNYTITGTFGGSNVFTAQLSDQFGSFARPTDIGRLSSITGGTIIATIPENTVLGLGYRIRVIGSSPSTIGTINNSDLKIYPNPTAVAGVVNDSICASDVVNLTGVLGTAAPFGTWTTSGTGTFSNPNDLNGVYTPSATDLDSIVLTLTSNDPAGPCSAASDQIKIRIFKAPSVNAGIDQNICVLTNSINLSGAFGGSASSTNWTSLGTGSFNNSTLLNAIYTPSALDRSAGFVKLVLSTNDPVGPCDAVRDTMLITFNPVIAINAGTAQTICRNSSAVLNASTNATSGTITWTTSGSGIFTNGNTLTPTYLPSLADNILGSVRLKITNFDPMNACQNNQDSMILTINQLAIANAGVNQTVCASSNNVSLIGTVSGSVSTGSWSTLGTGTFTNASSLITNYIFSAADKTAGTVRLILTSSDPIGPCNSARDTITITINPIATADAGPDQVICGNSSAIVVGSFGGSANSGRWTSLTNSPFISFTALTEYFPTPLEIANGFVVLTYTTNDPAGPCAAAKDSLVVALLAPAFSNAGSDQIVCASNNNVALTGTISGTVSTGSWRTLGSGTFTNANSLLTNYILSPNDKDAGTVRLILTSSDPVGPCNSVSDTMVITINPVATVDAGPDQIICSNSSVNITGTVGGSATSGSWTSSTNSSFISFGAVADYFPTPTEALNGSVVLTYSSDDPIGPCGVAKDSLLVVLESPPFSDAGVDQTVCSNVSLVNLSGNFGNGASSASWSTLGTGTFKTIVGNTAQYTPSTQDKLNGFVKILYTTNRPAGQCDEAIDTMTITIKPSATIFAGISQTICTNSNIVLNGSTTAISGTLNWSTSGSGVFLNGNSLTSTYIPSVADNISGFVTLTLTNFDPSNTCQNVNDALLLTINRIAIADAGVDQTVCSSNDTISIVGNVSGSVTKGSWRTLGTGTFTNSSSLTTNYILSPNDKAAGSVKLILTSIDPVGPCNSAIDTMIITISPKATVDAGPDQVICGNSSVNVTGTVGGSASSGSWTSSTNSTFISFTSNTDYLPTPSEVLNGFVVLTYTTNGPIGSCPAVKDSLIVALITPAFSNAGADQLVCSNVTKVNLIGDFGNGAITATWSTLGTGTFRNIVGKTAEYLPSTLDKFIGFVRIIYTTDDPAGPCKPAVDTMTISFQPSATIFAGINQTICRNNNIVLNGSTNATSGTITWLTSGTGVFSNVNVLNPTYIPSLADNISGSVKLTITNFDPINTCQNVADTMILNINQPAVSNAGLDQTVCASTDSVSIVGNISGSVSTGSWRTLGTGTFTNSTSLSTNYKFSASDKAVGSVELILTSSNPIGPCNSVSDTLLITINPLATVDAGPDQTICGNSPAILIGVLGGSASSGTWTSSTNSPFISFTSITNYFPTPTELSNGSAVLTYTSDDPIGPCSATADSLVVTFNPAAIVNAGLDQIICASKDTISLAGTISGSPTNVSWITLGTGTFTNDTSLNTKYVLSTSDKASGVVSLIFKDEQCLAVRDTVVITINQIPTVDAGTDQVICGNNSLNLVGIIGGSSTSGTWTSSTNSLFLSTDSTLIYTPISSQIALGSFFITYTGNDPSGLCGIVSDSMQVTVNIPPTVNAGKDINTCTYASSVDIIGTQAGFPTNPLWVTLNGSGSFVDPTSLSTKYIPSAADLAAKSIIISLTTNDPIGPCFAAFDDVNVYFKDSNVTFTSVVQNIYCDSMEIKFVNDSNNVGYTYAWDFGDGFFSNIANPIHTYNYTGSINVSLIASGPGGCVENVNNTFNINSVKPRADFVVNNLNQCLNDNSFEINNASQDASAGYINNVKWDFGDNTNSTAAIPNNKSYSKAGNYNIKLVVSTTNGCQDSIVKGVNVLQSPEKPTVTVFDGKILISSSLIDNHWYYSNVEIPGATNKYYETSKFGVYKLRVDSTNGCSNFSDDLDLKYTTKIENVTSDKFKIYPNPTKGLFNIESQLDLNYSIYDYSGKEIITGKKDGNIQLLDLSNFKSGIYLIKLFNDQEQFITKIMKD